MQLTYAITLCNEHDEFLRLFRRLDEHRRIDHEIVVLLDKPKADSALLSTLLTLSRSHAIKLHTGSFNDNFGEWKNLLKSACSGRYIFQLDADEVPHTTLLTSIPNILEKNPQVDIFLVPRINTVEGIQAHHIQQWQWRINENGWINFPDYQWRLFRNAESIRWKNKVHETLEGHHTLAALPSREEFCLYHHKRIERQERQNIYYERITEQQDQKLFSKSSAN